MPTLPTGWSEFGPDARPHPLDTHAAGTTVSAAVDQRRSLVLYTMLIGIGVVLLVVATIVLLGAR